MNREINTDKNMLEINPHGDFGFPINLLYVTQSAYKFGRFTCHWHPEIEIVAVLEGSMIYQVNQEIYKLTKHTCLFVNSNALHSGCMYENNDCEYIVITFNPSLIYGFEKSTIYTKYVQPIIESEGFTSCFISASASEQNYFFRYMSELGSLFNNQPLGYELSTKSILCNLWSILFSVFYEHIYASDIILPSKSQISKLKKAIQFIHTNYQNPITLEEMANSCHISKSEFCRIFKKTMHQTPFEYLLRYRIQKSLPLLIDESYTITEIATRSGFSGSSYYSEVFRKYMQCSPREYKKILNTNGNVTP